MVIDKFKDQVRIGNPYCRKPSERPVVSFQRDGGAGHSLWDQRFHLESGTKWRANLYRIDYDNEMTHYSWMEYVKTFHDYNHFGSFYFE